MKRITFIQESSEVQLSEIYGDLRSVTRIFYLFTFITLIGLIAGVFIVLSNDNVGAATLLAIGLLPVLASIQLVRKKRFELAAIFLTIILITLNTGLATIGMGIHSISNFAFPAILIIASLVTRTRTMIFLTSITVLCIGWLVFGELSGLYTPTVFVRSVPGDFFSASMIVVTTAVMAHRLTLFLFQSFSRFREEIAERKTIETSLRQREGILEAITFAAEKFLKTSDWRETIDSVLERLGKTINATHAYLFEDHLGPQGEQVTSMRYEWTAPGYPSDLGGPYFQNSPVHQTGFEDQVEALRRGDVRIGSSSSYNPIEKEIFEELGVKSILEVPIFVNGREWGAIGFDEYETEREWTTAEVDALKIAAGILSAAIERKISDETLRQRDSILEVVAEAANTFLKISERNADIWRIEVDNLLERLGATIDASHAYIFENFHSEDGSLRMSIRYEWTAPGLESDLNDPQYMDISMTESFLESWDKCVLQGLPYIGDNEHVNQKDMERLRSRGIQALLDVPIYIDGKWWGTIGFDDVVHPRSWSNAEVDALIAAANMLGAAIKRRRMDSILQGELQQRKKLIDELETKNAELERFTYTVSHDLKSPLITIGGFLGYLEEDAREGDGAKLQQDIQRINEATAKMKRLMDELLELSRIGRLMNPPEEVQFEKLAHEALANVQGQLEERGVAVRLGPNLPTVYGDRQRLVEVLQNLLDNAAKFMGDQTEPLIEIGQGGEEDGKPVFYVKDNGIGIQPEYRERIFGLFERLDPKTEGTGIGLALVKRIIEFHGGRIWVESASSPQAVSPRRARGPNGGGAGKGSTFYFTLPQKEG